MECEDDDESIFTIFLPTRICEEILDAPENLFRDLSQKATREKLLLKYLGGEFHSMEFVDLPEDDEPKRKKQKK